MIATYTQDWVGIAARWSMKCNHSMIEVGQLGAFSSQSHPQFLWTVRASGFLLVCIVSEVHCSQLHTQQEGIKKTFWNNVSFTLYFTLNSRCSSSADYVLVLVYSFSFLFCITSFTSWVFPDRFLPLTVMPISCSPEMKASPSPWVSYVDMETPWQCHSHSDDSIYLPSKNAIQFLKRTPIKSDDTILKDGKPWQI